eukprot:3147993-Ditylum_brightwellii.AAC.1
MHHDRNVVSFVIRQISQLSLERQWHNFFACPRHHQNWYKSDKSVSVTGCTIKINPVDCNA